MTKGLNSEHHTPCDVKTRVAASQRPFYVRGSVSEFLTQGCPTRGERAAARRTQTQVGTNTCCHYDIFFARQSRIAAGAPRERKLSLGRAPEVASERARVHAVPSHSGAIFSQHSKWDTRDFDKIRILAFKNKSRLSASRRWATAALSPLSSRQPPPVRKRTPCQGGAIGYEKKTLMLLINHYIISRSCENILGT